MRYPIVIYALHSFQGMIIRMKFPLPDGMAGRLALGRDKLHNKLVQLYQFDKLHKKLKFELFSLRMRRRTM